MVVFFWTPAGCMVNNVTKCLYYNSIVKIPADLFISVQGCYTFQRNFPRTTCTKLYINLDSHCNICIPIVKQPIPMKEKITDHETGIIPN